jgi:hypothetical protein
MYKKLPLKYADPVDLGDIEEAVNGSTKVDPVAILNKDDI